MLERERERPTNEIEISSRTSEQCFESKQTEECRNASIGDIRFAIFAERNDNDIYSRVYLA